MEFSLLSVPATPTKRRSSDDPKREKFGTELPKSISCGEHLGQKLLKEKPTSSKKASSVRRRATAADILAPDFLGDLTAAHVTALKKSWSKINNRGFVECLKSIFSKLQLRDPAISRAFSRQLSAAQQNACEIQTVEEHCHLLVSVFAELIESSARPSSAAGKTLQDFGRKHGHLAHKCKMKAESWETLGTVMVEKITLLDGVRQTKDAVAAWRILLAFLTDQLRYGYEQQCKVITRISAYGLSMNFDSKLQVQASPVLRQRSHPDIRNIGNDWLVENDDDEDLEAL